MKNPNAPAALSAAAPSVSASAGVVSRPAHAGRLPRPRPENSRVSATLAEFEELDKEAADLGVAPPAPNVREAARRVLTELLREFSRYYYAVSPGEGGEVAIRASAGMGKGRGVLIVCDDKDISCYVTMNGESRRAHYALQAAETLPDAFIREAMRELGSADRAAAAEQHRRIMESARKIAEGGDPFFPGYDPKALRRPQIRLTTD